VSRLPEQLDGIYFSTALSVTLVDSERSAFAENEKIASVITSAQHVGH
jgi:hypothetical protein